MPTISIYNQVPSQALRGESAKVTLNFAESSNLASFAIGMLCTETTYSTTGLISSIDVYGNSFEVTPIQPDKVFGANGYLPLTNIDVTT